MLNVLASDPEFDEGRTWVQFRLTYEGRLSANGSPQHKHEIRRQLHPQLRRLWQIEPNLSTWQMVPKGLNEVTENLRPTPEVYGKRYERFGYQFVPIAAEDMSLLVGLDIIFLRNDAPGSVIQSSDIDNRLKTLFDALKVPRHAEEIAGIPAQADEMPFFVLLEDDRLLSKVNIETDALLQPTPSAKGAFLNNDARLVITVTIKPHRSTWDNSIFG